MSEKIKWGVLGYARIARTSLIPAILRDKNSELYAIASRSDEKLTECSREYPQTVLYQSYDKLLNDPKVDAVYIPLPNSMHKDWTIKACQAGKHVLCEKPIALNSRECQEMIEAAQKNKVHLMEAFMYRYTDRMEKLKIVLESRMIGEIKQINSTYRFLLDRQNTIKEKPELGGGSLYDVGSYPVNFVGMITGELPVSYSVEYELKNGVDIIFSGLLKYKNGMIASINSGFNAFPQNQTEIIGTLGKIEIPDTFLGKEGIIRIITGDGIQDVKVEESDRYGLEVANFTEDILKNRPPLMTLEESLRNITVIENLLKLIK